MRWYHHHNNTTTKMWYAPSSSVISTPSRRPPQIHIKSLCDFLLLYSSVFLCWCSFMFCHVSGTPVIRIQKDLDTIRTNNVLQNHTTNMACMYKGNVYSHRSHVTTEEPCLNCTCSQGTLICYLRVCPDLPDPPPVGCIVLQRYQVCCPELICTENRKGGNRIESRAELDASLFTYNKTAIGEGCISNGTIYAEGSAMLSSSECEHCFCLAGQMNCVKPKCLLPLKGCEPIYEKNSCCPVRYDCSKNNVTTSTTEAHQKQACYSNGSTFYEGEKVIVPYHSNCDNCYCFHGKIHCEHLSCAPTLMGCEPIIPPEKCCATSYNCSGTIEVKPNGFYSNNPPDVSKNYAKLRKEQHVKYSSNEFNRNVITTEKIWSKTFRSPNLADFLNEKYVTTHNSLIDGRNNRRIDRPGNQSNLISNHIDEEISTTDEYLTTVLTTMETEMSTTEPTTESTIDNTTENEENSTTTTEPDSIITTTNIVETNETKDEAHMSYKSKTEIISVENCSISDDPSVTPSNSTIIYTKTVITTNFSNGSNKLKNFTVENNTKSVPVNQTSTTESQNLLNTSTEPFEDLTTTPETTTSNETIENRIDEDELLNITASITDAIADEFMKNASLKEMTIDDNNDEYAYSDNNTIKVNMSMKTIPPDIEAILNITKIKNHEFDDYDYNEPSLPPSLPNLKIIPFVAADAVDEAVDPAVFSSITKDKILSSENPIFQYDVHSVNLFSPPVETEGGFLPRDPPIIDSFYENSYHTTNIVDITSVTPVPSLTNPPKMNDNCFSKGRDYKHGELLSAPNSCVLCMCFFGDIVCQQPKCPPLKLGCKRVPVKDSLVCCGHVICENEAPTVVLDRLDVTMSPQNVITIANRITTSNPFRDVIRTEPAPDLQSLIGDIIPFIKSQQTTISLTSSAPISTTPTISEQEYTTNHTTNSTASSITTTTPLVQLTTNKTHSKDSPKITLPVQEDTNDFSFDKVLELLFASETTTKKSITTMKSETSTDIDLIESRIVNNNFDNNINYLPLKFPTKLDDEVKLNNENNSLTVQTTNISITTPAITQQMKSTTEKHVLPNLEHNIHHNNIDAPPHQNGVGLLKLAGCNIYGRMYRVGRIISELSGPCLECMCTDIGVQCRPLKC